jgi:sigma-B regulation protein RsbU (phosphoserine phosphatase)
VLEFLHATRKTGALTLSGDEGRRIWFAQGEPVDAACGQLAGEEALRALAQSAGPGTAFSVAEGLQPPAGRRIAVEGPRLLAALARSGGEDDGDIVRARSLQERLVARLPAVPGWDLAGHYEPMSGVGGDFYDAGPLGSGGRLSLTMGDVSGHGVQGALAVALAIKSLRLLRRSCQGPADLLVRLGEELRQDLLPGQFVTMYAASLDPDTGVLSTVLAGHHPSFLRRAGGAVERIGKPGMAVGLTEPSILARTLHPVEAILAPGDLVLQCTDGLLEAHDAHDEEFGEERVAAILSDMRGARCADVLARLCRELKAFAGEAMQDDLTLLAMARE